MAKQWGRNNNNKKSGVGEETNNLNLKLSKIIRINTKDYDEDTKVFILISQELKEEGNKFYEDALKIKPDFYEGIIALGLQQFERAKLSWYYAVAKNDNLDIWPSTDVIQLYNCAEDNMEKGIQMFEESEQNRLAELSKVNKSSDSDEIIEDIIMDDAAGLAAHMRSRIYILWGTMLYERSNMEYKLGLPVWQESLEVAIVKFELAGASPTDVAVMIKNHSSNGTA